MYDMKMWHKPAGDGKCKNEKGQKSMERRMSINFCGSVGRPIELRPNVEVQRVNSSKQQLAVSGSAE